MKFPTNVIFLTIISLMSTEAVVKRQKPGDTGYIDFNNNSPKNYPSVSKFKTIIKTPEESLEIESKPTEVPLTSTQKIKKKFVHSPLIKIQSNSIFYYIRRNSRTDNGEKLWLPGIQSLRQQIPAGRIFYSAID